MCICPHKFLPASWTALVYIWSITIFLQFKAHFDHIYTINEKCAFDCARNVCKSNLTSAERVWNEMFINFRYAPVTAHYTIATHLNTIDCFNFSLSLSIFTLRDQIIKRNWHKNAPLKRIDSDLVFFNKRMNFWHPWMLVSCRMSTIVIDREWFYCFMRHFIPLTAGSNAKCKIIIIALFTMPSLCCISLHKSLEWHSYSCWYNYRHILHIHFLMEWKISTVEMSRVNGRRGTMASSRDTTVSSSQMVC